MERGLSRRDAIGLGVQAGVSGVVLAASGASAMGLQPAVQPRVEEIKPSSEPWEGFPRQNAELAREVVGASHRDEAKVRELVGKHPALARATWDWGFGDWETALGAASHTGRRAIAEFLISSGARIDIFAAAMLGYVDVVRGFVEASPGIQKTRGPHGISLLAHARAGDNPASKVVEYLESVGGADESLGAQPLPPADQAMYVGEYSFGESPLDRLFVTQERDALWITRGTQSKRGLSYVGNHAFFPAGAVAVRIHFKIEAGKCVRLAVVDGDPVLEANRV